jgi:hypothetical protein
VLTLVGSLWHENRNVGVDVGAVRRNRPPVRTLPFKHVVNPHVADHLTVVHVGLVESVGKAQLDHRVSITSWQCTCEWSCETAMARHDSEALAKNCFPPQVDTLPRMPPSIKNNEPSD